MRTLSQGQPVHGQTGRLKTLLAQVGVVGVAGVVRPAASISSMALQLGAHTACALPNTLRVFINERVRCLPHKKQDIVALPSDAPALKGEPEGLDLYRRPSASTAVLTSGFAMYSNLREK